MGFLESLTNLFDFNLDVSDVDILNYTKVVVEDTEENDDKLILEDNRAVINLNALEDDTRTEVLDIVSEGYEETGELLAEDTYDETKEIETDYSQDRVKETLNFFEGKIAERHSAMLESALLLREAANRGREFEPRKQDIYEKYGQQGVNVINLCSSGYFDKGGYLRQLYYELEDASEQTSDRYQEVFTEIVENTPFTVFVNTRQDVQAVATEIRNRLVRQQRYAVEHGFVDVRGIGSNNMQTIAETITELEEVHGSFEWTDKEFDNEIRIRIFTDTFPDLPQS